MVSAIITRSLHSTTLKTKVCANVDDDSDPDDNLFLFFCFLIGIHSGAVTTRHGVTKKSSTKRLPHTGNLFRKNLQL